MSLQHETLAAGVVEEARLVPERIAVHDATGSWTYGRLLATADAVAAALHGVGLRNEDTVAVVGGRSARTVLALVGVLHAGGAYCVVDPGLPPARQALILEDLAPRAVLLVDPSATPRPVFPVTSRCCGWRRSRPRGPGASPRPRMQAPHRVPWSRRTSPTSCSRRAPPGGRRACRSSTARSSTCSAGTSSSRRSGTGRSGPSSRHRRST